MFYRILGYVTPYLEFPSPVVIIYVQKGKVWARFPDPKQGDREGEESINEAKVLLLKGEFAIPQNSYRRLSAFGGRKIGFAMSQEEVFVCTYPKLQKILRKRVGDIHTSPKLRAVLEEWLKEVDRIVQRT